MPAYPTLCRYNEVKVLHLLMLITMVVLEVVYVLLVLRPYLALHRTEAVKVAGIMSHVPQEIDVAGHTRRVISRVGRKQKKAPKAAQESVVLDAPV